MKLLKLSSLYIGALVTMPIHTLNINLGIFHLKFFQVFTLLFLLGCILKRKAQFSHGQSVSMVLFVTFICFVFYSSIHSLAIVRSVPLTFALIFCFLFFVATILFFKLYDIRSIYIPLVFSGALYSIWGGGQLTLFFLGYDAQVNFEAWDVVPRVPYFSSENVHAAFTVITALLSLFLVLERRRFYYAILLIVNVIGLVATGTRGAMLMFFLSSFILTLRYFICVPKSRLILTGISFVIVIGIVSSWELLFIRFESLTSGSDGTTGVRLHHFHEVYALFSDYVFSGIGLGASQVFTSSNHDVHNALLLVLFETGVLSFICFFSLLLYCISYFFHTFRRSKGNAEMWLIAALFIAIWGQAMFEPSTYFFHLYLSLGLLLWKPQKIKSY